MNDDMIMVSHEPAHPGKFFARGLYDGARIYRGDGVSR